MKTLYLLRHARTKPAVAGTDDFHRTLTERGHADAVKLGEYLRTQQPKPDLVISSPAVRARETTELVVQSAGLATKVEYESRIYEASTQRLLEVISEIDSSCISVLLVGHNPGIEGLLTWLAGRVQPMSTAALAHLDVEIDAWRDLAPAKCDLKGIHSPK